MFIKIANKISHYAQGVWVGSKINDPEYRVGLVVLTGMFVAYQVMGAWRKKDLGFPEIKEFMIGMGTPLAIQRYRDWMEGNRDTRTNRAVESTDTREGRGSSQESSAVCGCTRCGCNRRPSVVNQTWAKAKSRLVRLAVGR